ncbi:Purine-cytosine permease fcyB [Cladobotryum mycophilum]|uniref:Purine-cytosine permease fcyB n=1 Tax=Cladobotryum mycophilum TaxID=491253 RepID=A0ABR0SMV3_9HYPO
MFSKTEGSVAPVRGHENDNYNIHSDDESSSSSIFHKVLRAGRVEERGIHPVPLEERTSTRFFNIFTVWFSINFNILGITFGMLGPLTYNLGLRDSALTILFFCLLSTIPPAYLSVLGPRTGMRQMIQARYSFGRYIVSIPVLLNLATMTGFCIIICITVGQCLSAITEGRVSPDAGIVIISVLSLLVSFCGFKVLHIFETYASIPSIITIAIATGYAGSALTKQSVPETPPTAANVLNFGMIVAGYQIPWAGLASDFTTYFDPKVPSWRVFTYSYLGLLIPTVLLMTLGAAVAGAIPNNPEWQEAFDKYLVGGALAAMLSRGGAFGKFIVVVLSLTVLGNTCGTFYSITLNFQTLVPWLFKVPRYVFSIVITAIIIGVAISAVDNFFNSLENLIALIGYWSSAFVSIVMTEHIAFRRQDYGSYDHAIWSTAGRLPIGLAAISSGILCFGLVVPCMDQVWWQGPIAKTTGDIGFEVAFVMSSLIYIPLRYVEKRFTGR